jgi:hypothetical protein
LYRRFLVFSRGQQQPAIKWVTDEAIEVPSRGFGIYHAARSPDGSYTIAWDDGGEVSGRYVGGFRESGLGCYLLAFRDQIILEGKLERPNDGKVSNAGTFILNDWLFGRGANGVFHVFSRDGKSILSHRFEVRLTGNAISKNGRVAVCQLSSSPHEDGRNLAMFELDRGILVWLKGPEIPDVDSFDFDAAKGEPRELVGQIEPASSRAEVQYRPGDPIPEWNQMYSFLRYASPAQRAFYSFWKDRFERDLVVDIGDSHSYLFAYGFELIDLFVRSKDIEQLCLQFGRIATAYPGAKVISYLDMWFIQALLYVGMFDEAWEVQCAGKWDNRGRGIRFEDFLNIKCFLSHQPLDGADLIAWMSYRSDLTSFGKSIEDAVQSQATRRLREFEQVHGMSLVDHFLDDWDWDCVTAESLEQFREYYDSSSEWEKRVDQDMNGIQQGRSWKSHRSIFSGMRDPDPKIVHDPDPKITFKILPQTARRALVMYVRQFLRECENEVRADRGMPRIGEGWMRETQLYWEVNRLFPDLKVIHHGRPSWLGRQHLDIYIPEAQVAVEYQGKQHYEAVKFFGGEDALKKREELDRRKQQKCEDNGVALIIVDASYDWEQLSKQLVDSVNPGRSS